MKKLILILFTLFLGSMALKAQRTVVVCGQIDKKTANQKVWINFFSSPSTCNIKDSTLTDTSGKYSFSLSIAYTCGYYPITVNMIGCKSSFDTLTQQGFYDTLKIGPDTLKVNFKYCDTCNVQANFIDSSYGKRTIFTNLSVQGNPNKFKWYFGDGQTSTAKHPAHNYSSAYANYTACLVAIDTIKGCKDSVCRSVDRTRNCSLVTASFSNTLGSSAVVFTNTSPPNTNSYYWDFGNGKTSTAKNPSTLYNSSGTYTVCLVASDTVYGCRDTTCKNIVISANPCIGFNASFTDSIRTDTATFISNGSSRANKFFWTFGNGQASTAKNPTHIYNTGGVYTVCLFVQDTINSCSDSICRQITITTPNPCAGFSASFSDSIRSDTAHFTYTGSNTAHKFSWTFGNGQTSTAKNPTHIYNTGGVYTVCLVATDTISGCKDSICKVITTYNNSLCIGFKADFTYTTYRTTFNTTNSSSSTANKFKWDFGDLNTSVLKAPSHTYNARGCGFSYLVSLIAEDTLNNCKDSISKYVVFNSDYLNAGFTYTDSCGSITFTNTSSSAVTNFSWDFGNSQTSTVKNPNTTYNTGGNYTVCLIATDTANTCTDTVCKTISILNSINGTIYRNNNQKADSGRVWLISITIDSLTNDTILTAIDSAFFNSSTNATYSFNNVPSGDYLIKAALDSGAAFYSNRLPTYYDKETRWDKAKKVTVNKPCVSTDVVLRSGNNPGGAGFIGGLVKQGANKTAGDPLQKITVLLFNADGSPFAFAKTDINGNYEFDNIAYGDYTVVVDELGKPSDEYTVTIDANKPKDYDGNFEVNTKDVTLIKKTTHIVELTKGKLNLYPNPTNSNTTAVFNSNKNGIADIAIMDLAGKTILSWQNNVSTGNNAVTINTSSLTGGLYLVTIKTQNTLYVARLGVTK